MNKNRKLDCFVVLISILIILPLCISCSNKTASAPLVLQPKSMPLSSLKRDEYIIYSGTEAMSCAILVSLAPLPVWWLKVYHEPENPDGDTSVHLYGLDIEGEAEASARYRAIGRAWRADALVSPRKHVKSNAVFPWYMNACVTVRGKAIRIIPDKTGNKEEQFKSLEEQSW